MKNPIQSADIGSKTKRCVTINVTCAHKLSATAATAATCTTNGCKAYWYCSNCKKYFSDKDGKNEITLASTVIKATGHNYGAPSYTWSSDYKPIRIAGQNRYETCVSVNNKFKDILTGSTVCVAKGLDFPDALAGGVFAAQQKAPLFLADNTLKDEQKEYLKAKKADTFYVFGGTGAVADKLVTEITTSSK